MPYIPRQIPRRAGGRLPIGVQGASNVPPVNIPPPPRGSMSVGTAVLRQQAALVNRQNNALAR